MKDTTKQNIKRWIISSLVTFASAFCIFLLTVWKELNLEAFQNGAWISLIFTAIRAGIKAVIEFFVIVLATIKKKRNLK